ncbi:hypothetical protein [Seonamhaeicola sp. ML3]|uniref:hypothetical protein n=1 Tax=Seonamhaeicola sp. ML3 TaxID=2937786 RepID=UPI00200E9A03|nr:hypothetical protein [Seonamhaeicola sp. ML3]
MTIITLFLLFDEYLRVIDRVAKKSRRRVVLSVLAVLSVFSLVDVIIEVNEGDALVEKANQIIIQSDTLLSNTNSIIDDLEKNIKSVEESGESIVSIDSLLKQVKDTVSSQVELLKSAVNKSVELVELEEMRFKQDEAMIDILSSDVRLEKNEIDSSFFNIKYSFRNFEKRYAVNLKFEDKILLYNKIVNTFQVIHFQETFFPDLSSKTYGNTSKKINTDKNKFFSENY